jgi:hypothetical protein
MHLEGYAVMNSLHKTDWLMKARYGLLVHYLYDLQNSRDTSCWNMGKHTDWDTCVNEFSVTRFVDDVVQTGAGYVVFTIQQNSGYCCAPNKRYDYYCGKNKCSERDLFGEIADALAEKNIRVMMYASANAPMYDQQAIEGLSYTYGAKSPDHYAAFRLKWYEIIEEYAARYGTRLSGWWIDGCGDPNGAGHIWNDETLSGFARALKAGNQDAILCFNPQNMHPDSENVNKGIVHSWNSIEDYTAGEAFVMGSLPEKRFIGLQQWNMTIFMGENWAMPEVKYPHSVWINFMRKIFDKQGTITLDLNLRRDGSINPQQLKQMHAIKNAFK